MQIERIKESNFHPDAMGIKTFGNMFGDHMLICHYKDGKWGEPVIKPYGDIKVSPAMQALHYGQACFEGMKAYKNDKDEVFLFRPEKNFERLNKSAERLDMPSVPKEIFIDGLKALVDIDRQWVPAKLGMSLYLRPFLVASEAMVTARSSEEYMFMILSAVAPDYYAKPLSVKVADRYSRSANGGVGFAKAAGNYGAAFYPTRLAKEEGYDQVIWTDAETHSFIEEAGTMNVFIRIKDTLYTAPVSERILNGVTRRSLIELAKHNGWEVKEERIKVDTVIEAQKNGTLKEAFGCGTAVTLNNFSAIGVKDKRFEIEQLSEEESYGKQLKKQLLAIQNGISEDPFGWRVKVEKNN